MRLVSPRTWILALAAIGLGLMAQPAKADFTLELGNSQVQGITGSGPNQLESPYATLSIVGNTTSGLVTFTLSTSAHNASAPINAVFNDLSFNTALTLGTDFTLASASNGGTIGSGGNISEIGDFKYSVGGNGSASRDQPYVFVLQLTNNSMAIASNFAVANADGNYFAAHIYTSLNNGTTGYIGDSDGGGGGGGGNLLVDAPAPAGLILLATAVPVFGLRRMLRRKPIVA
jgi:hypothetical protein